MQGAHKKGKGGKVRACVQYFKASSKPGARVSAHSVYPKEGLQTSNTLATLPCVFGSGVPRNPSARYLDYYLVWAVNLDVPLFVATVAEHLRACGAGMVGWKIWVCAVGAGRIGRPMAAPHRGRGPVQFSMGV